MAEETYELDDAGNLIVKSVPEEAPIVLETVSASDRYQTLMRDQAMFEASVAAEQTRLDEVKAKIQMMLDAGFVPPEE